MRWTFIDPLDYSSYELEIGPDHVTLPHVRNVVFDADTPKTVALLAPNHTSVLHLQGTILSPDQFVEMQNWFKKDRSLLVVTQREEMFAAQISRLELTRVLAHQNDYRYRWDLQAFVWPQTLVPADVLVPAEDLLPDVPPPPDALL